MNDASQTIRDGVISFCIGVDEDASTHALLCSWSNTSCLIGFELPMKSLLLISMAEFVINISLPFFLCTSNLRVLCWRRAGASSVQKVAANGGGGFIVKVAFIGFDAFVLM